jgi:hypothetical protein
MSTHCRSCAPLAAEVAELKVTFESLNQTLSVFLERTRSEITGAGIPLVSPEEARATLLAAGSPAEAEPEFGRLYEFPGRSA